MNADPHIFETAIAHVNGTDNMSTEVCRQLIDVTFQDGVTAGFIETVIGIAIGMIFMASLWYIEERKKKKVK